MSRVERHPGDRAAGRLAGLGARVDDRRDDGARGSQCGRDRIGIVVVGEQHGAASRQDRVAVQIGLNRPRQHDAGPVVAGEDERPLQRPSRQHHPPRPDMPQSLARHAGRHRRPKQLANPLDADQIIAVVMTDDRRRRQQPHLRHRRQLADDVLCPFPTVAIADPVGPTQQGAAEQGVAVGQDDARAGQAGGMGGGQPGRPAADDQHIAMCVSLVVARRVEQRRGAA